MAVVIFTPSWSDIKPPVSAQLDRGHPLAKDLRLFYLLNEGAGGVAYDLVRGTPAVFNNAGTNDPFWAIGPEGTAVSNSALAGNGLDVADVPWTHPTGDKVTVMARAKGPATTTGFPCIFGQQHGGAPFDAFSLLLNATNWQFAIGTSTQTLQTIAAKVTGETRTLAGTYDGANMRGYRDGVLMATTAKTGNLSATVDRLCICGNSSINADNTQGFAAPIYWCAMWARTLSADEIRSMHIDPFQMLLRPQWKRYSIPGLGVVTGAVTIAGTGAIAPTAQLDLLAQATLPGAASVVPTGDVTSATILGKVLINAPDSSVGGINDDFEGGTVSGYSADIGGTLTNETITDSPTGGTKGLKLAGQGNASHRARKNFTNNGEINAGRLFVIRGWWRSDESDTILQVYFNNTDSFGGQLHGTATVWTYFEHVFLSTSVQPGNTNLVGVALAIGNTDATARTLYFDQVEAKRIVQLSATASNEKIGQATIPGTATVTPTGKLELFGSFVSAGAASLTLTGQTGGIQLGQVAIVGTGTVNAAGRAIYAGAAVIQGVATVTPSAFVERLAQITVSGFGVVTATGVLAPKEGHVTIAGSATVNAAPVAVYAGRVTVDGVATVSASGQGILSASATLGGVGTVSATGARLALALATLAGAGALVPGATVARLAQFLAQGQGAIIAGGNMVHAGNITIVGIGNLIANGLSVQFDLLPQAGTLGRVVADAYSPAGAKLNFGRIAKILALTYTLRIDALGDFAATLPADDERIPYLTRGTVLWFYREGEGLIFKGKVRRKEFVIRDGEMTCEITGSDIGEDLAQLTTLAGRTYQGSTLAAFMADILTGTGWAVGALDVPTTQLLARYDYATRVNAVIKGAEQFRYHARINPVEKTVDVGLLGEASGLVFQNIETNSPLLRQNTKLAVIADMTVLEEGQELWNKIIPIGGGEGVNQTTIKYSNRVAPYTIQSAVGPDGETYYWIQDATSIATYGLFERAIIVKDAVPLANSIAGQQAVGNALYDIGTNYLTKHKDERSEYVVHVAGLRHYVGGVAQIKPGMKARTRYHGYALQSDGTKRVWRNVDADLWILEFTRTLTDDGGDEWDIPVSTVDRKYENFEDRLVQAFDNMHALNVSLKNYTFQAPYILQRMSIQPSFTATLYAKLDSNISLLHLAKLTVTVRPVRSNVSVAASGGGSTSSGGSSHSHSVSGSTSGGGSSHSHTVDAGATGDYFLIPTWMVGFGLPVGGSPASSAPSTASTGLQSAQPPSNHDHSMQAHTHTIAASGTGYNVPDSGHTHSATSAAESSHSHSISGSTSGTETAHTHTVSAHTHPLTYGIFVGSNPSSPTITITINGVDRTSALGGPFNSVNSEFTLDVTQYLQDGATEVPLNATNTIVFGAAVLCDIEAILRLDLTRSALIPV